MVTLHLQELETWNWPKCFENSRLFLAFLLHLMRGGGVQYPVFTVEIVKS
jgi:hypothetical protein